jgi:Zn-finger nucleic acid-binding protein
MPARTYGCPACGAQVDEQARRCRYCAAPVATVRCATCFHMNVPEASYCSGCGRQLGLEPVGEAGVLPCPVCKAALDAYRDAAGALFDCALCGGQFVEHPLLREMLHEHEHAPFPGGAPPQLPAVPDPRNSYIPCPACAALMNRKNFGGLSGVIVDVCKKHGTWFDLGELPRVLAFVAAGGLERTRRRAEEEAADARRAALAAAAATPAPVSSHDFASQRLGGTQSLAQMFVDLLLH